MFPKGIIYTHNKKGYCRIKVKMIIWMQQVA